MGTDLLLPHFFELTLVSQLVRMIYLVYMQASNAADKVEIMFEIWKPQQNLKHSTATTCQKIIHRYGRKCTLSYLKIFVKAPNTLWKGVWRHCFFDSGTVPRVKLKGLDVCQVAFAMKKFKLHQQVGRMTEIVEAIKLQKLC